ncbi:MAG: methyltransferase domain-containing protein [Candidatus Rokubacteria bacterium]|nr:methyltransferase domain-containing protein [Candidatus Rokubacteria bacterium]
MSRRSIFISPLVASVAAACARATLPGPSGPAPNLAEYVTTPPEIVLRMLELAGVTKDDVVYDLGSGDGRIPILAAKRYGAHGVGVEIDEKLIALSRRNAEGERVAHLVDFRHQDALTVDLSGATVVTLYLGVEANQRLRPALRSQLRRGARVVSQTFDMGDWLPDRIERVASQRGEEHIDTAFPANVCLVATVLPNGFAHRKALTEQRRIGRAGWFN